MAETNRKSRQVGVYLPLRDGLDELLAKLNEEGKVPE